MTVAHWAWIAPQWARGVVWLDASDVSLIGSRQFTGKPDVWDSFSDFFAALLDDKEEDRAGR